MSDINVNWKKDTSMRGDHLDDRTRLWVVEATDRCYHSRGESTHGMDDASDSGHPAAPSLKSFQPNHRTPDGMEDDQKRWCDRCREAFSDGASVWTVTLTVPRTERFTEIPEDSLGRDEGALFLESGERAVAADRAAETAVSDIMARTTDIQIDSERTASASPTGHVGHGRLVLRQLIGGWYSAVEPSPVADRITALMRGNAPLSERWAVAVVVERSHNKDSHTVTVYVEDDEEDEAAAELAEFLDRCATPAFAGLQRID